MVAPSPHPACPCTPPCCAKRRWLFAVSLDLLLGSLLAVLVLAIFASRINAPTLRGEESHWGWIAQTMLQSGDWIVPRQQGLPFLDRPPLQYWLLAALGRVLGRVTPLAIRLPSVLAVLLTTLLVFGYARSFLTALGATAAGLAFATMGEVMQLGRMGETDALFTWWIAAALMLWHLGYVRRWPPRLTWLAGYGLAALGLLTKGPQAPIYFIGATVVFLAWRRDWSFLLGRAHAWGLAFFVAIGASWQVALGARLGWAAVWHLWMLPLHQVFAGGTDTSALAHFLTYPWAVFANTLPWSLAMLFFISPAFRRPTRRSRPYMQFLVVCLIVAAPSCWLPPDSLPRYFMPLYPMLAVLIGAAIERCYRLGARGWDRVWAAIANLFGAATVALATVVLTVSVAYPHGSYWAQPKAFAVVYWGLAILATVALAATPCPSHHRFDRFATLLIAAAFIGLTYNGVVINYLVRNSVDTQGQVERLRRKLPLDAQLASLGPIPHLFAYYYQAPIALLAPPVTQSRLAPGSYFCFDGFSPPTRIPFKWRTVATISVSRTRTRKPQHLIIVGRRL